jgi:hypothetical protein
LLKEQFITVISKTFCETKETKQNEEISDFCDFSFTNTDMCTVVLGD